MNQIEQRYDEPNPSYPANSTTRRGVPSEIQHETERNPWKQHQEALLMSSKTGLNGRHDWKAISKQFPGRYKDSVKTHYYYLKNRPHRNEISKRQYIENRDKILEKHKEQYNENRDKILERNKEQYYKRNKKEKRKKN